MSWKSCNTSPTHTTNPLPHATATAREKQTHKEQTTTEGANARRSTRGGRHLAMAGVLRLPLLLLLLRWGCDPTYHGACVDPQVRIAVGVAGVRL